MSVYAKNVVWPFIYCVYGRSTRWLLRWQNKPKVLMNLCVRVCVKHLALRVHFPGPGVVEGSVLWEVKFGPSCPVRPSPL